MEALITIHEFTSIKTYKAALVKHSEMVLSLGEESINEKNDLEDLKQRAQKILN